MTVIRAHVPPLNADGNEVNTNNHGLIIVYPAILTNISNISDFSTKAASIIH